MSVRTPLAVFGACVLAGCGSGSTHARVDGASAGSCTADVLTVAYDPAVDFQATGDRGLAFRVTNRGSAACVLDGYPDVVLRDARSAIVPFRYSDGHSQYVTSSTPQRVPLPPGGSAFFGVAKYRCDLGDVRTATTLRVQLPGQHATTVLALPRPVFEYCRGGAADPGNTIAVSPVVPTETAVL